MFLKRGESSRSFRADDVVRSREVLIAIELPAGKRDQGDGLSRVCFALIVTNICTTWSSGNWSKMMAGTVNGSVPNVSSAAWRASSLCWPSMARRMPHVRAHLQRVDGPVLDDRVEPQALVAGMMTAPGMDGRSRKPAGTARVLDELLDLAADDLPLVRLFVRGDAALEQVPVDLGRGAPSPAAHGLVP